MRKSLLFFLLTSAAAPAFAGDDDDNRAARREAARAERAERAEARAERSAERPQRAQRGERGPGPRAVDSQNGDPPALIDRQPVVVERRTLNRRPDGVILDSPPPTLEQRGERVRVRGWRAQEVRAPSGPAVIEPQSEPQASVSDTPRRERFRIVRPTIIEQRGADSGGALRERRLPRAEPLERLGSHRAPAVSRLPREGTQPPVRAASRRSRDSAHHWRGDWRSDRRYDWRDHRRRHRSLFHFGFYSDPFGWRYRPYSIGWRMWPSYYRSTYWLNDPWQYRLPYAPPGYRWIRYYDDAILVDTWDGQVVDVIYNFFW